MGGNRISWVPQQQQQQPRPHDLEKPSRLGSKPGFRGLGFMGVLKGATDVQQVLESFLIKDMGKLPQEVLDLISNSLHS